MQIIIKSIISLILFSSIVIRAEGDQQSAFYQVQNNSNETLTVSFQQNGSCSVYPYAWIYEESVWNQQWGWGEGDMIYSFELAPGEKTPGFFNAQTALIQDCESQTASFNLNFYYTGGQQSSLQFSTTPNTSWVVKGDTNLSVINNNVAIPGISAFAQPGTYQQFSITANQPKSSNIVKKSTENKIARK